MKRLNADIGSGLVHDVVVVDHNSLLKMHDDAIQKAQIRFENTPTPKNLLRLERAQLDKTYSIRDHEVLIKSIVPYNYLNFN